MWYSGPNLKPAVVTLGLLAACSPTPVTPTTAVRVSAAPLADHTVEESSHQGVGSSSLRVVVEAGGQVSIQRGAGPRAPCGALDHARLETLQAAVRRALAASTRETYNTSALPEPNANYSRHQTLTLAIDGHLRRVQIEGWADVPPEVSRVLGQLSAATTRCP